MATELFSAIDRRHTNRQPYEDRPVPRSVVDALVEAARQEGADLHVISDRQDRRRLVELIHEADLDHETNPVRIDEATKWTGVSDDRADGVPERALGPLPATTATPFRDLTLGRTIPGRSFAVFEAASARSDTALNDSPGGSISPFCEPATVTSTPHSS